MIIRKWLYSDNEQISCIEKQCFKTPWSKEMLDSTAQLDNFYGIVCEVAGKIVGYVGAIYDPFDSEILNIAVVENFRRQKIGEKLMLEIIDYLRKLDKDKVFLEVRVSNVVAQSLYQKLGFEKIGIRKKYYENTEDAIVMAKVLSGEN